MLSSLSAYVVKLYDGQRSLEVTNVTGGGTDVADELRELEILLLKTIVEFDTPA